MSNLEKYDAAFRESFACDESFDVIGLRYNSIEEWDSIGHMNLIGILEEEFDIAGLDNDLQPGQEVEVVARGQGGETRFTTICRIDTPVEINYYRNGGILHTVLRRMATYETEQRNPK